MVGKRIAPEGSEANQNKKWALWIGAPLGILLALYLGLSTWVCSGNTMLPNSYMDGVNVSGMTATQMEDAMSTQLPLALSDYPVVLTYGDTSKELDHAMVNVDASGFEAYLSVDRENFFTSGANYLGRLMGHQVNFGSNVYFDDSGLDQLEKLLTTDNWNVAGRSQNASYKVEGESIVLTKEVTGLTFDVEKAQADIEIAVGASLAKMGGAEDALSTDTNVTLAVEETLGEKLELQAIREQLNSAATDAYVEEETFQVIPHVTGLDFDLDEAIALYTQLAEGKTATLPLVVLEPEMTQEKLEQLLYSDVLGTKTTSVGGTWDRRQNVKLAASYVNGTVLLPGDVFSYNKAIHHCTPEAGFFFGDGYVGGETVSMVGGGVCQVSSTLYSALLTTSLEIVERYAHMYSVGYVPDGMDATYYTNVLDFKFKNNTEYPLKISTTYSSNHKLTVTVTGTKTDDKTYVPKSAVYDYVTNEPRYLADATIPQGTIVKMQTPYTGRTAAVTRDIYDADGNYLSTEKLHTDVFKSRPTIYHYNPLDAAALGIPGEYVSGTAVEVPVEVPTTVPTVTPPVVTEPEVTEPETTAPDVTGDPTVQPEAGDLTAPETVEPTPDQPATEDTTVTTDTESTNDDGVGAGAG